MQPKPTEALPERLGRYEVLSQVAKGGMASVYLGRATGAYGFEREVAIKLVHAGAEATLARDLIDEAKLAVRIRHPNVVQIADVGEDAAGVYLVMEYVEGDSLQGLVRRAAAEDLRVPTGVGLRVMLDALAGLHAAHELRDPKTGSPLELVHRDVSPHNLLVGTDGVTRLADFGIAKATSSMSKTMTGILKGKFSYMGPEQARGLPLDRRADVWAAGVIMWEVLTGKRLFPAGNDADTLLEIVGGPLPTPKSVRPDLPDALDAAVMQALTRDLKLRCPSAAAFRQLLVEAAEKEGIDVATPDEVAALVSRLAGVDVQARRRLLAEASERRAPAIAPEAPVAPPSAARLETATTPLPETETLLAPRPLVRQLTEPMLPAIRDDGASAVEPSGTGTFAPSERPSEVATVSAMRQRSSVPARTLLAVGLAVVAGAAVAGFAFTAGRPDASVAAPSGVPSQDVTAIRGVEERVAPPVSSASPIASLAPSSSPEASASTAASAILLSGSSLPPGAPPRIDTGATRPAAKPPACKGWERCR